MPEQRVHHRARRVSVGRVHDDAGRFVDREQMIVLVQDIEPDVFRRHHGVSHWLREHDGHDVAERGARGDAADRCAVHGDEAILDPRLDARATRRELEREVARRRTFAIISHPDAGKTTLTEKLLLYAGAIELAGAVRGRKARRHATSDWMALEQERGISITSAALEFELEGRRMSLLDTPGHRDFSEDTYRALIAADSVVMVIDAANGVEEQTRKLFEVCRRHRLPILTFINKFDRPARDPLELLDDLERTLGIPAAPVNWPVGSAERFRGVYDIERKTLLLYEREAQGQYRAPVDMSALDDPPRASADRRERVRAFPRVARRDPRRRHAVRCRGISGRDGRRRCSSAAR